MGDSNMTFGNAVIKVTPEVLVTQADEVRRLGNDMKQHFQMLADTMNKTKYYWIGEAGDLHRKLYEEQKEDVEVMLRRLLEHPEDLVAISANYQVAENSNVITSQGLQTDIIS